MWISFLTQHWKALASGLFIIGVWLFGFHVGSGHIQARWDAVKLKEYEVAQLKQAEWALESKRYQQTIADQAKTREANRRKINELSKKYSGCVANDDIISLWAETYGTNKGSK